MYCIVYRYVAYIVFLVVSRKVRKEGGARVVEMCPSKSGMCKGRRACYEKEASYMTLPRGRRVPLPLSYPRSYAILINDVRIRFSRVGQLKWSMRISIVSRWPTQHARKEISSSLRNRAQITFSYRAELPVTIRKEGKRRFSVNRCTLLLACRYILSWNKIV